MRCRWVIVSMALLSGCTRPVGLTYRTPAGPPSVSSSLALKSDHLAGAVGSLDPAGLLGLLIKSELLVEYPTTELVGEPFLCRPETRIKDIIRALEIRENWVYDPSSRAFYAAIATHTLDDPDAFGRQTSKNPVPLGRRPVVAVSIRFQNESGAASISSGSPFTAAANLSGQGRTIEFGVPDGIVSSWSDTEDRTYYEGVRDPSSDLTRQVNTTLRHLSAGVQTTLLVARLPGDGFRVDGTLTVASFVGAGLEQKSVTVPLQLDGPRHQWLQIFASEGRDRSGEISINDFAASVGLGRDNVFILIRVD